MFLSLKKKVPLKKPLRKEVPLKMYALNFFVYYSLFVS